MPCCPCSMSTAQPFDEGKRYQHGQFRRLRSSSCYKRSTFADDQVTHRDASIRARSRYMVPIAHFVWRSKRVILTQIARKALKIKTLFLPKFPPWFFDLDCCARIMPEIAHTRRRTRRLPSCSCRKARNCCAQSKNACQMPIRRFAAGPSRQALTSTKRQGPNSPAAAGLQAKAKLLD